MRFIFIFKILPLFVSLVNAYAAPGVCTGDCVVHDPTTIQRADGTYFRFATGNTITTATSRSLLGPWETIGNVLNGASTINLPGNTDLWAPDVSLVGNTYYLYYTISTFGTKNSAIGVATSQTLEPGSWTDHGSTGIISGSDTNFNAIDANLVQVGGDFHLTFGSFFSDIYQAPMKSPPILTSGAPYQVAFDGSGTHAVEGAFVWYRAPYYYLFFSNGICCGLDVVRPAPGAEYKVKVCRSEDVAGGYFDENGVDCKNGGGTVVLASHDTVYGPGGQSIFHDASSNEDVMVYHYIDTRIGFADSQTQFGYNNITWQNGWPLII